MSPSVKNKPVALFLHEENVKDTNLSKSRYQTDANRGGRNDGNRTPTRQSNRNDPRNPVNRARNGDPRMPMSNLVRGRKSRGSPHPKKFQPPEEKIKRKRSRSRSLSKTPSPPNKRSRSRSRTPSPKAPPAKRSLFSVPVN